MGNGASIKKAIDFATNEDIPILNFSGGGTDNHKGVKTAIENYPGLFVCSSGNENQNNDLIDHFPSNYKFSNLISVGAMDSDGTRYYLSNYGAKSVDIFAPGFSILSTYPTNLYKSTDLNNIAVGYKLMSGTSMATPFCVYFMIMS